jgi:hypothetical protein
MSRHPPGLDSPVRAGGSSAPREPDAAGVASSLGPPATTRRPIRRGARPPFMTGVSGVVCSSLRCIDQPLHELSRGCHGAASSLIPPGDRDEEHLVAVRGGHSRLTRPCVALNRRTNGREHLLASLHEVAACHTGNPSAARAGELTAKMIGGRLDVSLLRGRAGGCGTAAKDDCAGAMVRGAGRNAAETWERLTRRWRGMTSGRQPAILSHSERKTHDADCTAKRRCGLGGHARRRGRSAVQRERRARAPGDLGVTD